MNTFDSDNYLNKLLDNFVKNYQYYQYLKIKNNYTKKKKVSWNNKNLIEIYYY